MFTNISSHSIFHISFKNIQNVVSFESSSFDMFWGVMIYSNLLGTALVLFDKHIVDQWVLMKLKYI